MKLDFKVVHLPFETDPALVDLASLEFQSWPAQLSKMNHQTIRKEKVPNIVKINSYYQ